MIPFKLFKYIFFRDVLYAIVYGILLYIMVWGLIVFNALVSKYFVHLHIPLLIISILFGGAVILHVLKLILKQVIFRKYDKISVTTNLQEINWSFFFKIFIPRTLAVTVMGLIYWVICLLVFGNYDDTLDTISLIPCLTVDYFTFNWLLEDYINVSQIDNNNIENSSENKVNNDSKTTE